MVKFRMDVLLLLLLIATLITAAGRADDEGRPREVTFAVEVDFGRDLGQSFGSLFEVQDAAGRVVAGAGFQDVYNTHFRNDRHVVQFFVRPSGQDPKFTIERLPHPNLDCGVYLLDLDGRIYAWTAAHDNAVRRWDDASREWVSELPPGVPGLRSGDGVMRLGSSLLTFAHDTATCDGRVILSPPAEGGYHNFYYARGHLCFYHRKAGEGAFTHLYACPWTPEESGAVDLSRAVVFDTPYDRETPFAWGQWQDQVLTVSNMGGIYVFENGRWRTVLAPDDKTSYQVYSILHWQDRLLLAQYPTGNVFAYQGAEAQRIDNWPPRLEGVSPSARECQTLSIYRGEMFAGVWPWAELWRLDQDNQQWHSLGRMFTHPATTDAFVHPYEREAQELGLVLNHWGQRVTGMIPQGGSLILSTSAKGTVEWKEDYTFLTEAERLEYGAVLRLTMPGNLAVPMKWHERPTRFEFTIRPGKLEIRQEGDLLGATDLPSDSVFDLSQLRVHWGRGVFGPLRGRITHSETFSTESTE
ncbi:MAG: hypothetical protein KF861_06850 [Planctomycetaceae bacterium]|nr:hypothetical protein [Planctomycetaceae bacterium]